MTHNEWLKNQFALFRRQPSTYRNVLLVTSFIEAVVINEASSIAGKDQKYFKPSLEKLGLEIDSKDEKQCSYAQDCQYKEACLREINLVRVRRNKLLHYIIRETISQEHIEKTIKEMATNIEQVCTKSDLFRNYFVNNYGFDPKALVQ